MDLVLTAAVALGKTLVKSATASATGSSQAADVAGEVTSALGKKTEDLLAKRKRQRAVDSLADTVAQQVLGPYGNEFRALTAADRSVVVEAVTETFKLVSPLSRLVMEADFNPDRLVSTILASTADYLRKRTFGIDETELYRLILTNACAEAVRLVRGMSGLADAATPELLNRLTELENQIRTAPILAAAAVKADSDGAFADFYRRYAAPKLNTVDMMSTRIGAGSRRYSLSLAYRSLPAQLRDGRVLRVEDAVAGRRRVLLTAPCGAGKTVWLRRWFTMTANRGLTGNLDALNVAVPFYLPLNGYGKENPPTVDRLLDAVGHDLAGEMPQGWIQRQLRDHESLVLIDAPDELAPSDREPVFDWISTMVQTFPRPTYVLATRPGIVDPGWAAAAEFEVVDLLPPGLALGRELIVYWHEAIKLSLSSVDARAQVDDRARRLLDAMAGSYVMRELAKSPLSCAVMCALHNENPDRFRLPDQWLDLFDEVVRIMFERDLSRGLTLDSPLPSETLVKLMRDLAYWMATEGDTSPSRAMVRERIAYKMEPQHGVTAEHVLEYMIERTGFIDPRSPDSVIFTGVLADYFAGREAGAGWHIRRLIADAHLPHRQLLTVIAAGHMSNAMVEQLLTGLLERADNEPAHRYALHVLAHFCLCVAPLVGPELTARVRACSGCLIPRTTADADRLAAIGGPLVVDLVATQQVRSMKMVRLSVRAVAQLGGEDALPFLAMLARDRRPEVARELRRAAMYYDRDLYESLVFSDVPPIMPATPNGAGPGYVMGGEPGV